MRSRIPVIVILGATGSGKSKLGIEIARKFAGEILSADSMQVYKGLDIITNKVTAEERLLAPHHLLDIVEPLQRFTVVDFRNRALPVIEKLMQDGKLPVIVGGTNYYIESLLWKVLVENPVKQMKVQGVTVDLMDEAALEHLPSPQLYERLQAVDPDMAQSLHPNNKRKIIRSLQVYAQTGRTHSSILREQRSADGGSELGGPLRFPHSCILWLQCDQKVLDERLDVRVDTMLEQGLVQELLDFHRRYNKERLATSTEADYTKGIFQSIGFKEFHEYLVLSEEDRDSEKGSKLFHVGVDALKLVTRRYARRQLRWITNRFLCRPSRQVPPVYGLDATDPNLWNEHVLGPALQIVESYLKGWAPAGIDPLPVTERSVKNDLKIHHCDVCDRMFIGDIQWNDHLHSKKHRRMLQRKQLHKD
ncbi:tRNA isopentenyltransferase, mitochondrial [Zootermopsis nevadensis]|uniref:tRNA dimethylallyltransferase n=1 Tax=Zootermopsis nevadensis TaxID=136037 RepID=A0A067R5L3_ZOONE|nr:tRNA isopentenyltransferase, mitochondrial [Zootermopsis nevadensis]